MYDFNITDDNYISYCMRYYDNNQCNTIDEFETDLNIVMCIKKILDRYKKSNKINLRLLINHVIVLHNSFDFLVPHMLKCKLPDDHLPIIKVILVFLKYIEENDWVDVYSDSKIFNELRGI